MPDNGGFIGEGGRVLTVVTAVAGLLGPGVGEGEDNGDSADGSDS